MRWRCLFRSVRIVETAEQKAARGADLHDQTMAKSESAPGTAASRARPGSWGEPMALISRAATSKGPGHQPRAPERLVASPGSSWRRARQASQPPAHLTPTSGTRPSTPQRAPTSSQQGVWSWLSCGPDTRSPQPSEIDDPLRREPATPTGKAPTH